MAPRIAILAAALAALTPALARAQAPSPGAPGDPYPPYGSMPVNQHVRDSWYIGFGLGGGTGEMTAAGTTGSFKDFVGSNGSFVLQFEVGATLRPDLLLGLDVRGVRAQGNGFTTTGIPFSDGALQVSEYLAMLTWFPTGQGFFLRGGLGLAAITEDLGSLGSNDTRGVGALACLGYAFWLGQHFNMTLNLDASAQAYGSSSTGAPESSRFVDAYLGFTWY